MPKGNYTNESIKSLSPVEAIRFRPEVMLGSADINGCMHAVFEILSNSVDEARAGYGDTIRFTIHADNSITIEDYGRGVPLAMNEGEGRYNYELVYMEMYSGGKYYNDNYSFSLGLNGLGAMACQCSSAWFDVESRRDGKIYRMHFEKGIPVGDLSVKRDKKPQQTGTVQTWLPDLDVFTETVLDRQAVADMLRNQAIANAGLSFVFRDEREDYEETFLYPEGITGYVSELGSDAMTEPYSFSGSGRGRDREDKPDYDVKAEIAFCFDAKNSRLCYFHNSSPLEHGGSPDKAVRAAFVSAFDREMRERKKYTAKESKITFADIEDCLVLVSNSFSTQTSYENQTKKAINNKYIQMFLTDLIREQLAIWMIEHRAEAEKAIDRILINKRSREASESQRIQVKKKLMQKTDVTNKVKKFVDCRSKDPNERELFICEGDSALGSLLTARDAEFQALMPIRGKILNIEKASMQQVFGSEIIMDLIRVFGCGIEVRGKRLPKDIPAFDIGKLRFSKIIITTDADVDGFHIATLVTTMIYRLCPQLIEQGYLYIVETPLYEITDRTHRTPKTLYAFTDGERDRLIKGKDPQKITIQRSKGLGENDSEMMHIHISPGTRKLTRVTSAQAKEMEYWFDLFMGNDVPPRKKYIEENGYLYMDNLDVS